MLKILTHLLGEDAVLLRRYLGLAIGYGLLSGVTILTFIPIITYLMSGDSTNATVWLVILLLGILACWLVRSHVEKAGVR
ncbi:MAG: hypothetical protein ACTHXU_13825, partial [Halomonas sp.]